MKTVTILLLFKKFMSYLIYNKCSDDKYKKGVNMPSTKF